MGIKLVFYGEHEAEYGSPLNKTKDDKQEASFSDNTKDEIFISGVNINTLIENFGIKNLNFSLIFHLVVLLLAT